MTHGKFRFDVGKIHNCGWRLFSEAQRLKQEDEDVDDGQQHTRHKNNYLHVELLARHLIHDCAGLGHLRACDHVLVRDIVDQIALLPQVLVRIVHGVDRLLAQTHDVLQLVVLVVKFVLLEQQFLAHLLICAEVGPVGSRRVHELIFVFLGLERLVLLVEHRLEFVVLFLAGVELAAAVALLAGHQLLVRCLQVVEGLAHLLHLPFLGAHVLGARLQIRHLVKLDLGEAHLLCVLIKLGTRFSKFASRHISQ